MWAWAGDGVTDGTRPVPGARRSVRGPRRTVVTSPQTRIALTRPRSGPVRRQPRLPAAQAERARRVRRRQLRWALLGLAAGSVLVIGLPLVLALTPGLGQVRWAGVPLTWLAVALLPYPVLVGIAFWQLRGAERIEDDR